MKRNKKQTMGGSVPKLEVFWLAIRPIRTLALLTLLATCSFIDLCLWYSSNQGLWIAFSSHVACLDCECMMVFREETAQDDIRKNIIEREGDLGFEPRS